MRRHKPRNQDGNHADVRGLLRKLGCVVEDTSDVGRGFPDLLVKTRNGTVLLVEVKDGRKSPSKRRLSDDEAAMMLRWGPSYQVVMSEDDAVALARL